MPFAELYKNIFEKNGPNEHSADLLQELVKEYPYFSLAHFYLLQQTPESADRYPAVAARTALHFNNPYFLQAQLKNATQKTGTIEILDETETDSPAIAPEVKEDFAGTAIDQASPDAFVENEPPIEDIIPVTNAYKGAAGTAENEASVETEPVEQDAMNQLSEEVTGDTNQVQEQNTTTPAVAETVPDETAATPSEETDIPAEIHYVPIDLPAENIPEVKPTTELVDVPAELEEVQTNNQEENVAEATAPSSNNLLSKGSPKPADNSMIFEPLHATDYFASQGIKLREETQPADKLGKQLKSFTEWLKTMKKVHDTSAESNTGNIDLSVQTLAEKSNKEEEILTEAMADVFIQQGKANKAREIYQKLSLLNPAKSAYFAAKIDQIK